MLWLPNLLFQSTPPARGATPTICTGTVKKNISIHAPREGGDVTYRRYDDYASYISIHAPREGGDLHTKRSI